LVKQIVGAQGRRTTVAQLVTGLQKPATLTQYVFVTPTSGVTVNELLVAPATGAPFLVQE
jgi:hypothetical protein